MMREVKNIAALLVFSFLLLFLGSVVVSCFKGMSLVEAFKYSVDRIVEHETGFGGAIGFFALSLYFVLATVLWYSFEFLAIQFHEKVGWFMMTAVPRTMKEHVIVCGGGRVGRHAASKLKELGEKYVIIEKNPDVVRELRREKLKVVEGDCLDTKVLQACGIKRAKAIIAALGQPEDNFYLAVIAKELNPKIKVLARANNEIEMKRLKKLADFVMMPEVLAGYKFAEEAK